MKLNIYPTKEAVAEQFSEQLHTWMATNKSMHIALSGGSTPKIVFDFLARHYKTKIDWNSVFLYWGDERCVPPTDEESNYKMTVGHLLSEVPIPETNIFRIKGERNPEEEAEAYSKLLAANLPSVADIPQFDLVILGMGDDGHTASIFPHEIALWNSEKNCEVAVHPTSGQKRVSITGKLINNAKRVSFLVTGKGKAEKLEAIVKKTGNYLEYPASLVNPTSKNLDWFLDEAAASGIE